MKILEQEPIWYILDLDQPSDKDILHTPPDKPLLATAEEPQPQPAVYRAVMAML